MYAKVMKDSAASTKAWGTRRKTTASNTKETHRLIREAAGMAKPKASKKTDTANIGSVATALGIL